MNVNRRIAPNSEHTPLHTVGQALKTFLSEGGGFENPNWETKHMSTLNNSFTYLYVDV